MAYTNISKPNSTAYTNQNTVGKQQYDEASITYDDASVFYDGVNYNAYTSLLKPVSGPAVLIQSAKAYTGLKPLLISYPSPVTYNNLLIVCVSTDTNLNSITISDNQNNTWYTAIHDFYFDEVVSGAIFYAYANGNNLPVVSLTSTFNQDIGGSIYEYSGLTGVVVKTNTTLVSSSTTTPTASPLNISESAMIISLAAQEVTGGTFTASGGGFTLLNSNGSHVDAVSDYRNAVAGSYSSIFNFNHSNKWLILQAAFQVGKNYTNINKPI